MQGSSPKTAMFPPHSQFSQAASRFESINNQQKQQFHITSPIDFKQGQGGLAMGKSDGRRRSDKPASQQSRGRPGSRAVSHQMNSDLPETPRDNTQQRQGSADDRSKIRTQCISDHADDVGQLPRTGTQIAKDEHTPGLGSEVGRLTNNNPDDEGCNTIDLNKADSSASGIVNYNSQKIGGTKADDRPVTTDYSGGYKVDQKPKFLKNPKRLSPNFANQANNNTQQEQVFDGLATENSKMIETAALSSIDKKELQQLKPIEASLRRSSFEAHSLHQNPEDLFLKQAALLTEQTTKEKKVYQQVRQTNLTDYVNATQDNVLDGDAATTSQEQKSLGNHGAATVSNAQRNNPYLTYKGMPGSKKSNDKHQHVNASSLCRNHMHHGNNRQFYQQLLQQDKREKKNFSQMPKNHQQHHNLGGHGSPVVNYYNKTEYMNANKFHRSYNPAMGGSNNQKQLPLSSINQSQLQQSNLNRTGGFNSNLSHIQRLNPLESSFGHYVNIKNQDTEQSQLQLSIQPQAKAATTPTPGIGKTPNGQKNRTKHLHVDRLQESFEQRQSTALGANSEMNESIRMSTAIVKNEQPINEIDQNSASAIMTPSDIDKPLQPVNPVIQQQPAQSSSYAERNILKGKKYMRPLQGYPTNSGQASGQQSVVQSVPQTGAKQMREKKRNQTTAPVQQLRNDATGEYIQVINNGTTVQQWAAAGVTTNNTSNTTTSALLPNQPDIQKIEQKKVLLDRLCQSQMKSETNNNGIGIMQTTCHMHREQPANTVMEIRGVLGSMANNGVEHNNLNPANRQLANAIGIVPQFPKTLYTARGRKDEKTMKEVRKAFNEVVIQEISDVSFYQAPITGQNTAKQLLQIYEQRNQTSLGTRRTSDGATEKITDESKEITLPLSMTQNKHPEELNKAKSVDLRNLKGAAPHMARGINFPLIPRQNQKQTTKNVVNLNNQCNFKLDEGINLISKERSPKKQTDGYSQRRPLSREESDVPDYENNHNVSRSKHGPSQSPQALLKNQAVAKDILAVFSCAAAQSAVLSQNKADVLVNNELLTSPENSKQIVHSKIARREMVKLQQQQMMMGVNARIKAQGINNGPKAPTALGRIVDQRGSSNGMLKEGEYTPRESNGSKVMSSSFASLGLSAALLTQNHMIASPNQQSP